MYVSDHTNLIAPSRQQVAVHVALREACHYIMTTPPTTTAWHKRTCVVSVTVIAARRADLVIIFALNQNRKDAAAEENGFVLVICRKCRLESFDAGHDELSINCLDPFSNNVVPFPYPSNGLMQ